MLKTTKSPKILNIGKINSIDGNKLIIKLIKSKAQILFKSQKSSKLGIKLSKSENLSKIDTTKARTRFLIFDTKITFNYL